MKFSYLICARTGVNFESIKLSPAPVAHACKILATQETEIRRIGVRSQQGQIVRETLSQEKTHHKKRAGRVTQGVGPEFKPQYRKKSQQANIKLSKIRLPHRPDIV
jgi:hypothetical protein